MIADKRDNLQYCISSLFVNLLLIGIFAVLVLYFQTGRQRRLEMSRKNDVQPGGEPPNPSIMRGKQPGGELPNRDWRITVPDPVRMQIQLSWTTNFPIPLSRSVHAVH